MYILTFKRSKSIYFEKGLDLAISLGGKWDGQQMVLEIPDGPARKSQVFFSLNRVMAIMRITNVTGIIMVSSIARTSG